MKQTAFLLAVACLAGACGNDRDYDATGIFEANTVTVSAETAGKILRLNLDEGDSLTMGQSVGIVDTTQLALRRKQLQSRQRAAEQTSPDIAAQAAALRAQIAHQQEECARIGRLLADGAATGKQADDARARLNVLRGGLRVLRPGGRRLHLRPRHSLIRILMGISLTLPHQHRMRLHRRDIRLHNKRMEVIWAMDTGDIEHSMVLFLLDSLFTQ